MRHSKTSLCATALFVLASAPQVAQAQLEYCVATYTDFAVNTTEGEVEAWAWVEDYFDDEFCGQIAYYQWGYWTHNYFASAEIESPTSNSAYDDDYIEGVPYGGGSASASTSISFFGDPGEYVVKWRVWIYCVLGGLFIDLFDDGEIGIALFEIARHTSASLTESEVDSFFVDATELHWNIDGEDDVACPLLFLRNGSIDVFTEGDGTINDAQQRDEVIAVPGLAKVVRQINYCNGPPQGHTVGCSAGAGMILVRTTPSLEGNLWAHEYGHNQDLWLLNHHPDPNFLGYYLLLETTRRVTQNHCDAMRVQN